jgi:uncharacterized membrane protein YhaH (DUF805 family)
MRGDERLALSLAVDRHAAAGGPLSRIAVAIRRLHDTGRSGFWILLGFIPVIGAIVLIVFLAQAGNVGPNEHGADPKQEPAYAA